MRIAQLRQSNIIGIVQLLIIDKLICRQALDLKNINRQNHLLSVTLKGNVL
jgi:hypothetical protein